MIQREEHIKIFDFTEIKGQEATNNSSACGIWLLKDIGIARGGPEGPRPPKGVEKKFAQPFQLCKRDKYIRESLMFSNYGCECRSIYAAEMSNMTNLWLSGVFFQALNTPKLVFGQGSAPDPTGELTTFPQIPWSAGEGDCDHPCTHLSA